MSVKKDRGRPTNEAKGLPKMVKTAFALHGNQVEFMDRLLIQVANSTGDRSMGRGHIIRALLTGLEGSGFDVSGLSTVEQVENAITGFFGKKAKSKRSK